MRLYRFHSHNLAEPMNAELRRLEIIAVTLLALLGVEIGRWIF